MSFFEDLFDIHEDDGFEPRAEPSSSSSSLAPTSTAKPAGAGVVPFSPSTSTRPSPSTTVPTSTSARLTSTQSSTIAVPTSNAPTQPTPTVVKPTTSSAPDTDQQPDVVTNVKIKTNTLSMSPSATPTQNASSVDNKSKGSSGPSPVALGVTLTVVILMILLTGLFFFRRHHINKRKNRRQTWNAPVKSSSGGQDMHGDAESHHTKQDYDRFDDIDINEKKSAVPLPDNFTLQNNASYGANYPYPAYPQNQYPHNGPAPPQVQVSLPAPPPPLHPTGLAPIRSASPPPVDAAFATAPAPLGLDTTTPGLATGYNAHVTPIAQFSTVTSPHPSMVAPSFTSPHSGAPSNGVLLTVARTFVPSLPDELSVQIGEQIRVIEKYDDGWALCERMKAGAGVESGVVPVECLQYPPTAPAEAGSAPTVIPGMGMMQERVDTWRLSHRISSLHPVGRY